MTKKKTTGRKKPADPKSGKPVMVQVGFRLPQSLLWAFEDFVTDQKRNGGEYTSQGKAAEEAIQRFLVEEGWV